VDQKKKNETREKKNTRMDPKFLPFLIVASILSGVAILVFLSYMIVHAVRFDSKDVARGAYTPYMQRVSSRVHSRP